jgi:hypothetical protein
LCPRFRHDKSGIFERLDKHKWLDRRLAPQIIGNLPVFREAYLLANRETSIAR